MRKIKRKIKGLSNKIELFILEIPLLSDFVLKYRKEKYLQMKIWGGGYLETIYPKALMFS